MGRCTPHCRARAWALAGALLGAAVFLALYGVRVLDPTDAGWMLQAGADPAGPEGKALTDLHRRWLTVTGNPYDPAKHRGLAELYVADGRFTAYYDRDVPGCARFLRDAVLHWVP